MVDHGEAVVVPLHFCGVGVVGIVSEKVIAELFAGLENFGEVRVIVTVGFDGKIEEFECTVNGFGGACRVTFGGPL